MTPLSEHIGRAYMKFQIGYAPVGYALALLGFLTFAKVWQGTFEDFGIPFAMVLLMSPVLVVSGVFVLGHYMVRFKVQEAMQSLGNTEGNREFKRQCDDVKAIRKLLEENLK
jgi:hypothetical protein